jgi:hypothetical protein
MAFVVGHGIELLDMTLNEAFEIILKFQFASTFFTLSSL